MKKVLLGIMLGLVLVAGGLTLWAHSVLGQDAVRLAVAARLTEALGQPVTIGGLHAAIFPRVTLTLTDVAIGSPARIQAAELRIGMAPGALLSRRVEHGTMRLTGARVEFPLPPLPAANAGSDQTADAASPLTIASIDAVTLDDAELVSGGRTIRGTVDIGPGDNGAFDIRRMDLDVDGEAISVVGRVTDITGPVASLAITASTLSLDKLLVFAADFAGGTGPVGSPMAPATAREPVAVEGGPDATAATSAMDVTLTLETTRALFVGLALDQLSGTARVTARTFTLNPARFDVFGGHYEGTLTSTLERTPAFRVNASVRDIDTAAALAFVGVDDTLSGRLRATIDVHGRGLDLAAVQRTLAGTATITIENGVIRRLGLARQIVLATSMRADSQTAAAGNLTSTDEPFQTLGGTFVFNGGQARSSDLALDSDNLRLRVAGLMGLQGASLDFAGRVQLSEALTAQAGRDLARYTEDEGRATIPVSIGGTASAPAVSVDVADLTRRAIVNRATEEVNDAVERGLGRLFGR